MLTIEREHVVSFESCRENLNDGIRQLIFVTVQRGLMAADTPERRPRDNVDRHNEIVEELETDPSVRVGSRR